MNGMTRALAVAYGYIALPLPVAWGNKRRRTNLFAPKIRISDYGLAAGFCSCFAGAAAAGLGFQKVGSAFTHSSLG